LSIQSGGVSSHRDLEALLGQIALKQLTKARIVIDHKKMPCNVVARHA
jgi:hypothetical protein